MAQLDDDPPSAPRSAAFLQVVAPGRPATFLADGGLVVVARDALDFDVVLRGSLVTGNSHAVARVLAVIVAHADTISLSLRGLDELDGAGAVMLDDAAKTAMRLDVGWRVVDGDLMLQIARDRSASGATTDPPSTRRRPRTVRPTFHRPRTPVLPIP